ncbi:hypothetical protein TcWFU_000644 [Taenia crassiceps]|uniref:Uncharacterized protein n=1 Tax=Taenia crassiceps TaxID=6207 RepID=A0ABR4QJI2_9CEST
MLSHCPSVAVGGTDEQPHRQVSSRVGHHSQHLTDACTSFMSGLSVSDAVCSPTQASLQLRLSFTKYLPVECSLHNGVSVYRHTQHTARLVLVIRCCSLSLTTSPNSFVLVKPTCFLSLQMHRRGRHFYPPFVRHTVVKPSDHLLSCEPHPTRCTLAEKVSIVQNDLTLCSKCSIACSDAPIALRLLRVGSHLSAAFPDIKQHPVLDRIQVKL